MIEIRIHGRGGQGAQIAATLLASAAFKQGKYGQAFAIFAGERRGAPVAAFVRIDENKVLLRCQIYRPDHVVVLDPALMQMVDVTAGFKGTGWLIVNSKQAPQELGILIGSNIATVDASRIAVECGLGSMGMPIVNTAMLGALCRVTNVVTLDALRQALEEEFPATKQPNIVAAEEAYRQVRRLERGDHNAKT
ncbi:MAG TPA: pyruvate ferredoxin oxidoreductase [Dehalococcoidia bacterium]|nr:pyruvate ferredoxin oxidoreductase [Dehalococcoidia bacterium]